MLEPKKQICEIWIGSYQNTLTKDFSNFSNLLPEILAVLPTGCRDESTLYEG